MKPTFNKGIFNKLLDEIIDLLEDIRKSGGYLTFQKSVAIRSKLAKLNVEAKKLPINQKGNLF